MWQYRLPTTLRSVARESAKETVKETAMYKQIVVPVDLADPNLAKPALETAVMMADRKSVV